MSPAPLEPHRQASPALPSERAESAGTEHRRIDTFPLRRPVWRQDLVDTERGLVAGFRGGAGISGQLFVAAVVLIAGVIFGLSAMQWLLVTLMLTGLLVCELFRQAILRLDDARDNEVSAAGVRSRSEAEGLLLAAMMVARAGTACGLGILFVERLYQLLVRP